MRSQLWVIGVIAAWGAGADAAQADIIVDFEALSHGVPVGSTYAGLGLSFSGSAHGVVHRQAGGGARFSNNPSGDVVLGWSHDQSLFINAESGFADEIGFHYSTRRRHTTLSLWSGENGTGDLLASFRLPRNDGRRHANWDEILVPFTGIARSLQLHGAPGTITYLDDFSFTPAPLPGAMGLVAAGLACAAACRRRMRTV